ncbi:hypothetical protein ETH_00035890, partial [Eimeria tenella]
MVVSVKSFCTRSFGLGAPPGGPLGRLLQGVFGAIGECCMQLPRGLFLWELLHPQTESGYPLLSPLGIYGVRLFLEGRWRLVEIDDRVPDGGPRGAPVFPLSSDPREAWGPLLAKGLLKAFRGPLLQGGGAPPLMEALTGRKEVSLPLSPSLLSSYCLRGLWASVKLRSKPPAAAAAAAAAADAGGAAEAPQRGSPGGPHDGGPWEELLGWTPFLVAAVKEGPPPAVSLLNRHTGGGPLQDLVGAPGELLQAL